MNLSCCLILISRLIVSYLLISIGVASPAYAQVDKPVHYEIPHTETSPRIDGSLDEEEWADALTIELTNETHPRQNVPALVNTTVYVMEDGENYLVAFKAYDPNPEEIRAFYRDRDRSWSDDMVGFTIDTFNDERRAFEFFSNPFGIQMDLTNDDVSGREDSSWNAIWDSAGSIVDDGFIVEMRVPLKQIRVPSGLPVQTWGVDFLRFYPRDVRHRLSNNTWDYSISCYLCQIKKASGFPDLKQTTNLQLIPTVTSLWSESRPDPVNDDWDSGSDQDAGVDLRWGINEDMILNATLNPDFSQVEADNPQLDVNNTFTLFFQERRQFFLDGADYFNTQADLVYTRNIQDPDIGAKLTGKAGNHTYGVLLADDQRTAFVMPGTQGSRIGSIEDNSENLILRYRYDHGRNVTLGTLVTHRQSEGYANTVTAADMQWRLTDRDRINGQVMLSDTENPLDIQTDHDVGADQEDEAWRLIYSHQGENLRLNLRAFHFGDDFRADMGSINRTGLTHYNINPQYVWRPEPGSFLNTIGVFGFFNKMEDSDGVQLEKVRNAGVWMEGPMQSWFEVGGNTNQRYWNGRHYDLSGRFINGGFQPWAGAEINLNIGRGRSIDFANSRRGEQFTFRPNASFQIGRHLQAQFNLTYQAFDVMGQRLYTTKLSDVRLTYQFSNKSFLRAIVVHSDTERDASLYNNQIDEQSRNLSTQLLYSYRFDAQTRFFIGYSDGAIQNDESRRLEKTSRSVFAKFSYAWQM